MKILYEGKDLTLPDFFIAGAVKSGTTSLYYYFKKYKEIYFPEIKEPSYFSDMVNPHNKELATIGDYSNLFSEAKTGQLIGDASPGYIYYYENFIRNIQSVYGKRASELKIIIVLRNPADRAYSNYLARIRDGLEERSFLEAINDSLNETGYDYVGLGMYSGQIKAILKSFPQVYVYLFDDFKGNPQSVQFDICDRLNIQTLDYGNASAVFNKSGVPKSIFLDKIILNNQFDFILLQRDFPF